MEDPIICLFKGAVDRLFDCVVVGVVGVILDGSVDAEVAFYFLRQVVLHVV